MCDPLLEHVGLPLLACIMPNPPLLNKIRCYLWGPSEVDVSVGTINYITATSL